LFSIEAKHTYKGKNINRKHTYTYRKYSKFKSNVIYIRLFSFGVAIKLSLDPLLGYQREERLNFLNRQRHCYFVVDAKMCVCLNKVASDPSLAVLI